MPTHSANDTRTKRRKLEAGSDLHASCFYLEDLSQGGQSCRPHQHTTLPPPQTRICSSAGIRSRKGTEFPAAGWNSPPTRVKDRHTWSSPAAWYATASMISNDGSRHAPVIRFARIRRTHDSGNVGRPFVRASHRWSMFIWKRDRQGAALSSQATCRALLAHQPWTHG